jgi:hypothetical protein
MSEWVMMQTNKDDKVKKSKMGNREELVEVTETCGGERDEAKAGARGHESLL